MRLDQFFESGILRMPRLYEGKCCIGGKFCGNVPLRIPRSITRVGKRALLFLLRFAKVNQIAGMFGGRGDAISVRTALTFVVGFLPSGRKGHLGLIDTIYRPKGTSYPLIH